MAAVAVAMPQSDRRPGPYSRGAAVQRFQRIGTYGVSSGEQAKEDGGVMYNCGSLSEWLCPKADNYQGLRVTRSLDPYKWQSLADQLANKFDADQLLRRDNERLDRFSEKIIDVAVPEATLQCRIQDAALAISSSLPPVLAKLVHHDALEIARTTCKLLPGARQLIMKLEMCGISSCSRWHLDHYVCRSIVSYNCTGTVYTSDSNVNFSELKHGGNNDHIIRDESCVHSVDIGDIMMIKGIKYPGKAKSLVHKSPEVRFYDNGDVQNRIILKVDVMDLA